MAPIFPLCYDVRLFIVLRDGIPILDDIGAKTVPRRDSIPVQTINRLSGRVGQYICDGDWRGGLRQDKVLREVEKKLELQVERCCHRRVDVIRILDLDPPACRVSAEITAQDVKRQWESQGWGAIGGDVLDACRHFPMVFCGRCASRITAEPCFTIRAAETSAQGKSAAGKETSV